MWLLYWYDLLLYRDRYIIIFSFRQTCTVELISSLVSRLEGVSAIVFIVVISAAIHIQQSQVMNNIERENTTISIQILTCTCTRT